MAFTPVRKSDHSRPRPIMFEFQKLDVYQKTRLLNKAIFRFLKENPAINRNIRDQWTRATLSIPLNIAEGSSRFAKKEKRHFYIIARSSAMECVAAMDALADQGDLSEETYRDFAGQYDSITRMLFRMIQTFSEE